MNRQDMSQLAIDKYTFRANARRKTEFGVHSQSKYDVRGASEIRHYVAHNPAAAKEMIRDNIRVLRLMRSKKFKAHMNKMTKEARKFYITIAA